MILPQLLPVSLPPPNFFQPMKLQCVFPLCLCLFLFVSPSLSLSHMRKNHKVSLCWLTTRENGTCPAMHVFQTIYSICIYLIIFGVFLCISMWDKEEETRWAATHASVLAKISVAPRILLCHFSPHLLQIELLTEPAAKLEVNKS